MFPTVLNSKFWSLCFGLQIRIIRFAVANSCSAARRCFSLPASLPHLTFSTILFCSATSCRWTLVEKRSHNGGKNGDSCRILPGNKTQLTAAQIERDEAYAWRKRGSAKTPINRKFWTPLFSAQHHKGGGKIGGGLDGRRFASAFHHRHFHLDLLGLLPSWFIRTGGFLYFTYFALLFSVSLVVCFIFSLFVGITASPLHWPWFLVSFWFCFRFFYFSLANTYAAFFCWVASSVIVTFHLSFILSYSSVFYDFTAFINLA